jgi:hypothetical protein
MVAAVLLSLTSLQIVKAHEANSAELSPDLHYVALTVHGEADCQYLFVIKIAPRQADKGTIAGLRKEAGLYSIDSDHNPEPKGTVIRRMDSESFVWLPEKGHALIFAESGIYGDGIVEMWTGGSKRRTLATPSEDEAEVFVTSYDPAKRKLTYKVRYPKPYPKFVSKIRHLTIPRT